MQLVYYAYSIAYAHKKSACITQTLFLLILQDSGNLMQQDDDDACYERNNQAGHANIDI